MIDFNNLITRYLKRASRQKQIGRYYPSEAGGCMRKMWFSYLLPRETEAGLIKVFEVGNMLHEFVVKVLQSEKNPEVELIDSELPLKLEINGVLLSGRIDDVVLIKLSGKKVLVEVKSTGFLRYVEEPSEANVMQLQLYMRMSGIKDGIILYVEKNTLQSRWFNIEYSEKEAERAIKRLNLLHESLIKKSMPEAEAKTDKKKEWMCRGCPYRDECERGRIEVQKPLNIT